MGPPAPSPVFCPASGFPILSLFLSSPPGETPKFTPMPPASYPPARPRPAAQLAPGPSGHRLQLCRCHPAPAVPHAHAPQPTFPESASGGAQCSDWVPRGGVAGIGPRGCRLRGGSAGRAPTRMRKAWLSGSGADACCWGRLPRRGMGVSLAVRGLRRLEGRGTPQRAEA